MTNTEMAQVFEDIAGILKLKKDNVFKIRAYQKVAGAIRSLKVPVERLAQEGRLKEIPGAGEAIIGKITEMINTGKLDFYERLKAELPARTNPAPEQDKE
jgi:DNA polymerase (family 10)